ncbi:MAG: Hpt domain-containing protein [Anaeromyxobacter sp.]
MSATGEAFAIDRGALIAAFLAEAEEVLTRMEQGVVALEARPRDDELLHAVFRDAHTLKGGSALVGFDASRALAHDLEQVLERLRKHDLSATAAMVTLLLQSVDVLRAAIHACAAGRTGPSEPVTAFRARLAEATRSAAEAPHQRGAAAVAASEAAVAVPGAQVDGQGRTLRVEVGRLDRMLDLSGEIAVARGRLTGLLERGAATPEELLAAHREANRLHLDLQELIMKARRAPIGPAFHPHVRTVRDLASRIAAAIAKWAG